MMLQDGSHLECPKIVVESPLGKDLAVGSEKMVSLEVKSFNWPLGKEVLPTISFLSWLVSVALWGCRSRVLKGKCSPL